MEIKPLRLMIAAAASAALLLSHAATPGAHAAPEGEGWIKMFNGENLDGWKASDENPDSFQVEDGILVVDGPRGHLFYTGEDGEAEFTDFEFTCKVLTKPKANSGVFFHTKWQADGWPSHGYEAQVNATHSDRIKTGSVYAVKNVMDEAPHEDNEWFEYGVKVVGKTITITVNGEVVNEYTEPDEVDHATRKLSSGTIALQAHDPESVIHFKDIYIRPLD